MSTTPTDASIPVLTQVIGAPAAVEASSQFGAVAPQPQPVSPQGTPPAVSVPNSPSRTEEEWRALELRLNERVLRQILRRADFVIEHRLKEGLSEIVEKATQDMVREIKDGLQATLEDVVMRAVAQEMARVQAIKE